ncbi:MAG: hypothetical protein ABIR54_09230 [Burkholderiaceae bacterium]
MRFPLAALALTCLAGASSATFAAEPPELLKPMAFLAGHCWKGTFADGKTTDEHCFAWMLGGHALRDTHRVRKPGKPDGVGESTYYVDSAGNHLDFLYIENSGGFSRGTVESLPEALLFPDTQYISDGEALVYRARWTRQGDKSYEAWSEAQTEQGWSTMLRMVLKRVD